MQKSINCIILLSIFSLYSFADDGEYQCSAVNLTENISDMTDILSTVTADACNETSNDVDLINLMKCAPAAMEMYDKNKEILKECEGVSKSYYLSRMMKNFIGPKYPGRKGKEEEKSSLVEFMSMDGNAATNSKEQIAQELSRNILQFAGKTNCPIERIEVEREYTSPLVIDSIEIGDKLTNGQTIRDDSGLYKALNESVSSEETKEKHKHMQESYMRKYGETIWASKVTQSTCSTKIFKDRPRYFGRAALPDPTCDGRVTINFKNDSSEITDSNLSELMSSDEYSKLKGCIDRFKAKDLKIKDIKINGSANRFTGKNIPGQMQEATQLNRDLALRRAESTQQKVLGGLLGEELLEDYKGSGKQVRVSASGSHGDGTSGPCPYSTDIDRNGHYKIKDEYKDNNSLKKYRYASVSVTFEDLKARKLTSSEKKTWKAIQAIVSCRSYTVKCRE